MYRNKYRNQFIIADFIASGLAWSLFYLYRKLFVETLKYGTSVTLHPDLKFFISLVTIPIFWFLLNYSVGTYADIRRRKHSTNILQLFLVTLTGSFIIFFTLLLDDSVVSYINYYLSFIVLFFLQLLICFTFRTFILSLKNHKFRTNKDQFRVLMIGEQNAVELFKTINKSWLTDNHFLAVKTIQQPHNTNPDNLQAEVAGHNIEEVFIIAGKQSSKDMEPLLLELFRMNVKIRISPGLYAAVNIPVSTETLDAPLLLLSDYLLNGWQRSMKILFDIFVSVGSLVILSPLIAVLAIVIKSTSKGPVLYNHQRIGKNGRPFHILKFRSMYLESEPEGPQLSSCDDKRITPIGRFMRKRRLDEIPNFINVIKGEMSLVGPRPERKFYIDQIVQMAPQYAKLHLVKPGITSWGQVKFGYAKNIDEMVQRMHYDLVYIENISFYVDFRILLWTIRTIVKGKGV
jgi:exopolysaccharide biosynthesis polyprenyl glycosylphosphotransferase